MILRIPPAPLAPRSIARLLIVKAGVFLLSPRARVVRFGVSGLLAAFGQFAVLAVLLHAGWNRFPANLAGMAVGAQISFFLGCVLTWRDREYTISLFRRWVLYHGSIVGTALINLAVFAVCQTVFPAIVASALGIGVAAIGNFLAGDRLIFRAAPCVSPSSC